MSRDALVVGINQYQALPKLRAAAIDAEAIAQRLSQDGEFRVQRLPEIIVPVEPSSADAKASNAAASDSINSGALNSGPPNSGLIDSKTLNSGQPNSGQPNSGLIDANDPNSGTRTRARPQVGQRTGVSVAQLEAALVQLFKPSGPNVPETALFYFSGHGLQKSSGIHEGYLATSEANPQQGFFGLSLFWLRRLLQESPVRQRIIWLDCCHSGALLDVAEVDPGAKAGTSRFLMAASREYASAYESLDSQYSVLTEAILEGLDPQRVESGIITNHSLTDWVNTRLKGQLQQPLFENSGTEIWLTRGAGRQATEGPVATSGPAIAPRPAVPTQPSASTAAEATTSSSAKGKSSSPRSTEDSQRSEVSQEVSQIEETRTAGEQTPETQNSDPSQPPQSTQPSEPSIPAPLAPPSPFPGLQAFQQNQAYAFTGRIPTIKTLLRAVHSTPLVSLVGGASSGKTSLVQAGLLPALKRLSSKSGQPWLVRQVHAGHHKQPLLDLAEAFVDAAATEWERGEQLRRNSLLLASDSRGLVQLVQNARTVHDRAHTSRPRGERDRRKSTRFLLVIDGFESLLQPSSDPDMGMIRQHFLANLVHLMQEESDWVRLLLVVRSDYWDACYYATELLQQGPSRLVGVDPLDSDAMTRAITHPLQRVGWQCEAHLPSIVLGDIATSPSRMALMQLVLKSLWEHPESQSDRTLRLCTYAELGGVRGLLVGQATQLLETLTPTEQKLVQRIFLALTQLGDGAPDSLRTISKSDLGIGATPTPRSDELIAVLETLIESRLVYSTGYSVQLPPDEELDLPFLAGATPRDSLQAAHEALIRDWPALQDWLKAERPRLVRQRRIETAAKDWCDRNEMFAEDGWLQGRSLREAETYLREHPDDLSTIAQHYIHLSHKENKKRRKNSKLLQFGLPTALSATLFALIYQAFVTRSFDQTEHIKAMQAQQTTKQILSDPEADPTAALLLNRLAANGARQGSVKGDRSEHETIALNGLRESLRSIQLRGQFKGRSGIERIQWSNDQQTLVGVNDRGQAYLWRVAPILAQEKSLRLQQRLSWPQPAPPSSPLMRSLLNSSTAGIGAETADSPAPSADPRIRALSLSADSRQVAAIAQDKKEVAIWSLQSGKVIHQLKDFPVAPEQIHYSPALQDSTASAKTETSPQPLLAVVAGRTVHLWGTAQEPKLYGTLEHLAPIEDIAFSQDGQYLLTSAGDRRLRLWNLDTGIQEQEISASTPIEQISLSPSGKLIAALGRNGTLYIWDRRSGDRLQVLKVVERFAQAKPQQMLFSADESTLVSVQGDRAWVWDVATGDLKNMLQLSEQEATVSGDRNSGTPAVAASASRKIPPLVRLSPDGTLLLAVDQTLQGQQQGQESANYLWNLKTGEKLRVLRENRTAAVRDARFSADGSTLVSVRGDGQLAFWDSQPGYEMPPIHIAKASQAQGFAQPSAAEVVLSQANPLRWLNLKPRQNLQVQPRPSGLDFLLLDEAGQLRRWDLATGLPEHAHKLSYGGPSHSGNVPITAADWTSTLSQAVTAHQDGTLQLWQLSRSNPEAIQIDDLSQDIVSEASTGQTATGQSKTGQIITNKAEPITSLQLSQNGQMLLARDHRKQIYLWDLGNPGKHQGSNPQRFLWPRAIGAVEQAEMSRDGKRLATVSLGGTVTLWNIQNGQQLNRFEAPGATAIALDDSGKTLAIAQPEGSVQLISIQTGSTQTGEVLLMLPSQDHRMIRALSFSDEQLATATMDGRITLWDRSTGERLSQLKYPAQTATSAPLADLAYSPDGEVIAAVDSEGTVAFWAATEKSLRKLARDRSFRQLTPQECLTYLKLTEADCPQLPGVPGNSEKTRDKAAKDKAVTDPAL